MNANMYYRFLTFEDAEEAIDGGRSKVERKVGNNTWLKWVDENTIAVQYHNTYIVKIHRDGIYTLTNGGYRTVTTKERLNTFSPLVIWQEKYEWYYSKPGPFESREKCEWENGLKVNAWGEEVE